MYEHRYQKKFGEMLAVAWRLLRSQQGFRILGLYLLLHAAALADRWGWRRMADFLRRGLPIARVEAILSSLLGTRFRFVSMEFAGCAVDIDNEPDYDAAREGYERWRGMQIARVESRLGPLPLPAPGKPVSLSVLPEGRRR
jgi:hypothetical protein